MVIVVDDDVDIYNMDEVIHALCTKCHPVRGIRVRDHEPGNPLNPFLNLHERINGLGSRVIFDCTWPLDWPKESVVPAKIAFNSCYSPEVQERALGIWERALTAAQAAQKVVGGVAR